MTAFNITRQHFLIDTVEELELDYTGGHLNIAVPDHQGSFVLTVENEPEEKKVLLRLISVCHRRIVEIDKGRKDVVMLDV